MIPSSAQRIAFFDNAKLILIFIVVLGHALALIQGENKTANALINFVYLFYMPVFVLLSGYFSKRAYTREKGLNANRVIGFVVLYVLIYTGFWVIGQIADKGWGFNAFSTNSLAWYMLAMAWWTVLIPLASRLGAVRTIGFFLVLSLLIGFNENFGGFLVLSRTIVFAPFFFAGYFISPQMFTRGIDTLKSRRTFFLLAALVLIAFYAACYFTPEPSTAFHNIVVGYKSYTHIGGFFQSPIFALAGRTAFYLVATVSGIAFLALIPKGSKPFTKLGERTLSVYALHALVLNCSSWIFGFGEFLVAQNSALSLAIIFATSVLLTAALSWERLASALNFLLKFNYASKHPSHVR